MNRCLLCLIILLSSVNYSLNAKTLVFCSEDAPFSYGFAPNSGSKDNVFDASSRQLFNQLVEYKVGTNQIIPSLAQSWVVINDNEYIFRLRRGVKFHTTDYFRPTRNFNADDVVFSFERLIKRTHPYFKSVSLNGAAESYGNLADIVHSVQKEDNYTVSIRVNSASAPLMEKLASENAAIHSKEYAEMLFDDSLLELFERQPIGTGPFKFVDYEKESHVEYVAHDLYWKGKANINNIKFDITQNANERNQKLANGECQVMGLPLNAKLPKLGEDSYIEMLEDSGINMGYLAYNTRIAPFNNAYVRRALSMAINKKAILEALSEKYSKNTKRNSIMPGVWSYQNDRRRDEPYDPKMAKKLLAKVNVKKLTTKILAMSEKDNFSPKTMLLAQLVQDDWKKIGVHAEIVSPNIDTNYGHKEEDLEGVVLYRWTQKSNGEEKESDNSIFSSIFGCDMESHRSQISHLCYEPYNELVRITSYKPILLKRTDISNHMQMIFQNQDVWPSITTPNMMQPSTTEVNKIIINPIDNSSLNWVDIIN